MACAILEGCFLLVAAGSVVPSDDRLMFQYRPNQPVSPMTAVFHVRSAALHNTVVRYALVAEVGPCPRTGSFWVEAPVTRHRRVRHSDSRIARPGNDRSCYRPCENSAAVYMQGSTGTCDSTGHVWPPGLLANGDPYTRLNRNFLNWRNGFSGPILSFHTGWLRSCR